MSIIETLPLIIFRYIYLLFHPGVTAIPKGVSPTGTVAVTLFVVVSITETLFLPELVTYTFVPSGVTATP